MKIGRKKRKGREGKERRDDEKQMTLLFYFN